MALEGRFVSPWGARSPHPGLCSTTGWAEQWYPAPSLFPCQGDAQVDWGAPPAGLTHRIAERMLWRELGLIYSKTLQDKKKKEKKKK